MSEVLRVGVGCVGFGQSCLQFAHKISACLGVGVRECACACHARTRRVLVLVVISVGVFFSFCDFFFASQKRTLSAQQCWCQNLHRASGGDLRPFLQKFNRHNAEDDRLLLCGVQRERERESSHMCREEKKNLRRSNLGPISGAVTGKKKRDASFYIKGECRECCILADFCFFCFFLLRLVSVAKKKMTVMVSLRKGCPT